MPNVLFRDPTDRLFELSAIGFGDLVDATDLDYGPITGGRVVGIAPASRELIILSGALTYRVSLSTVLKIERP